MQIPHWKFTLIKWLDQKLLDRNTRGPQVRKSWSLNSSQAWVCKEHFALQLSPSRASVVGWPQLGQVPTQLLPSTGHGEKISWKQKSRSSVGAWICCKETQHLGWINGIVSLECPLCKFDSLTCVFVGGVFLCSVLLVVVYRVYTWRIFQVYQYLLMTCAFLFSFSEWILLGFPLFWSVWHFNACFISHSTKIKCSSI